MRIEEMVRAVQQALGVGVDGRAGPQTWTAIHRHIVGPLPSPAVAPTDAADLANARSEAVIATLLPEVRPYARALYFKAAGHGITLNVLSGLRTYAEQDDLYARGRTTPGNRVTNARGGYSNHNFGIAFDIGVFQGRQYLPRSNQYKAVGVLGEELGLEWGGSWTSFVDQPHFQLRPGWAQGMRERDMLAEFRRRQALGQPLFP